jgi:hypothetical protein
MDTSVPVRLRFPHTSLPPALRALHEDYDLTPEVRRVYDSIQPSLPTGSCVWVYARNVCSLQMLPVWIFPADPKQARVIDGQLSRHWNAGLLPLLCALDALVPGGSPQSPTITLRCSIRNDAPKGAAAEPAAGAQAIPHIVLQPNHLTRVQRIDGSADQFPTFPDLKTLSQSSLRTDHATGSSYPMMACAPATAHVCSKFNIHHGMLAHKTLYAAWYDMVLNTRGPVDVGSETLTILTRPTLPFETALGATIYAASQLPEATTDHIVKALNAHAESLRDIRIFKSPGFSKPPIRAEAKRTTIPSEVCDTIYTAVADGTKTSWPHEPKSQNCVWASINGFLEFVQQLCDEYLEGRPSKFGVLLGNPFLTRFWPGQLPTPIAVQRADPAKSLGITVDELVKLSHVVASPWHRCIVMPYGRTATPDALARDYDVRVPLFAVALQDIRQAVAEWKEGVLWSSTGGIYARMTQLFPWSVGAIVGPGSRVRVYARGNMLACKDAKGWRFLRSPRDEVASAWRAPANDNAHRASLRVMETALQIAMQVSPLVRPAMHGGFILYSPTEQGLACVDLHALQLGLAPRLDGSEWLIGLELFPNGVDGQMDIMVAERLIRAAMLDGAVVLVGPCGKVHSYAQRVNPKSAASHRGAEGTKRATAQHFVECAPDGSFAIAVSSDGPIRLYHKALSAGAEMFMMPTEAANSWRP